MKSERLRLSVLWYPTLLHASWGILLLLSAAPLGATPLALMYQIIAQRFALALALLLVSSLAVVGLASRPSPRRLLWFIPQQLTLMISGIGGLGAAMRGSYADGVLRPTLFILSDQLPIILLALLYTFALFLENGYHVDPLASRD